MNDLVSDDFINSILDEIESLKSSQISMAEEGEYITFNLAGGVYGILLLKVKEIIKIMPTISVVEGFNCVRKFIRLRDRLIPVYDLRGLLGLEKADWTDRTCIIILEAWHDLKLKQFGMIIDSISETLKVHEENLVEVPEIFTRMNTAYLLGMAKQKDEIVLLLNTDSIFKAL